MQVFWNQILEHICGEVYQLDKEGVAQKVYISSFVPAPSYFWTDLVAAKISPSAIGQEPKGSLSNSCKFSPSIRRPPTPRPTFMNYSKVPKNHQWLVQTLYIVPSHSRYTNALSNLYFETFHLKIWDNSADHNYWLKILINRQSNFPNILGKI